MSADIVLERLRADRGEAALDDVAKIDGLVLQSELAGLDLRDVEDVVDEREEMLAGAENILGVFGVARDADRPHRLILDDLGEADDRVQGRAQLMAHIGEELRFRLVGGLGAFLAVLQLEIDLPQADAFLGQTRVRCLEQHPLVGELNLARGAMSDLAHQDDVED